MNAIIPCCCLLFAWLCCFTGVLRELTMAAAPFIVPVAGTGRVGNVKQDRGVFRMSQNPGAGKREAGAGVTTGGPAVMDVVSFLSLLIVASLRPLLRSSTRFVVLAASFCPAAIQHPAFSAPPNILLIVGDDIGYGDLSCYGNKDVATPNLDAIAAGGTRFTSGYVMAPVCGPSRAALLSGRYPAHVLPYVGNPPHGSSIGLPREHRLLSDYLHDAGYRTAALGKWHLGEGPGFEPQARGFDSFFGFLSGMHDYFHGDDKEWGPIMRGREKGELKDYLTFALADEAAAIIRQPAATPFFIYLAFNATHTPLQVPDAYLQKTTHLTPPARQRNMAMMLALDDAVGRVMTALRESGKEEQTLVLFVSDNGAALIKGSSENGGSNAPLRGSKTQCWEGGIRVPFFAQWKSRWPAARVIDDPVCTLDLLPTLLAAADITPPTTQKLDGLNLLPWLDGKGELPKREPLCFKMSGNNLAIRDGDLKFVRVGSESGLFNVRTDPNETTDLSAKRPIITRQLQAKWQAWDKLSLARSAPKKSAKP